MVEAGVYKVAEPDDIETPAMLIFAGQLDNNIAVVAELAGGAENLIVHVKTHKSPAIARMQVERGARGLTVATVDEAEAFAEAGFDDLRLASPVVGPTKLERLAALAASGSRSLLVTKQTSRRATIAVARNEELGGHG